MFKIDKVFLVLAAGLEITTHVVNLFIQVPSLI